MYDPNTARFTSQDPLGFAAGDPNLYRYVGNSPTNYTDPSGMDERPWYYLPRPSWTPDIIPTGPEFYGAVGQAADTVTQGVGAVQDAAGTVAGGAVALAGQAGEQLGLVSPGQAAQTAASVQWAVSNPWAGTKQEWQHLHSVLDPHVAQAEQWVGNKIGELFGSIFAPLDPQVENDVIAFVADSVLPAVIALGAQVAASPPGQPWPAAHSLDEVFDRVGELDSFADQVAFLAVGFATHFDPWLAQFPGPDPSGPGSSTFGPSYGFEQYVPLFPFKDAYHHYQLGEYGVAAGYALLGLLDLSLIRHVFGGIANAFVRHFETREAAAVAERLAGLLAGVEGRVPGRVLTERELCNFQRNMWVNNGIEVVTDASMVNRALDPRSGAGFGAGSTHLEVLTVSDFSRKPAGTTEARHARREPGVHALLC